MTTKQAKIARHKARRKARRRHIMMTSSDVNSRKHIAPPLPSRKTILWELQTNADRLNRIHDNLQSKFKLNVTEIKSREVEMESRIGVNHRLVDLLEKINKIAYRRKNRKFIQRPNMKDIIETLKAAAAAQEEPIPST